jgi:acetyl-CoA acetyltransferase
VWVASSSVATARFDDGLPRALGTVVPPSGTTYHSEASLAVAKALESAGVAPGELDLVELQDNTVFYELAFPEDWGLCQPGEAERLVEKGETLPTGKLPVNPSGGFLCFGEATTAMGVFQVCELTWQLRRQAGARQVPDATIGLGQTLGLGGNATAVVLKS